MDVIVYLPGYEEKHDRILSSLAAGIPGAVTRPLREYKECDIAVIFGSVKESHAFTHAKRVILERHKGRRLLMVESAFCRRGEYFQVGWGGYAGNADFRNDDMPSDRWEAMEIKTRPWNSTGRFVVVCGQLLRDTQVQYENHAQWCRDTVSYLHSIGEHVIFRPHPREKPEVYGVHRLLHDTRKITESMRDAKCVVTWNSTSSVDALIHGIPAITMHKSSIAYKITQHSLEDVKRLKYPSRSQWFANLGYSMWTENEMREGLTWAHLTR